MPPTAAPRRLLLVGGLGLLARPALAQGGGGGTGSGAGGGSAGGASGMSGATREGGQQPASPGPSGEGQRARTERQLRDAGVEAPPEQREQQLRDLNEISRQLSPPGTPVPAPEVDRSGR